MSAEPRSRRRPALPGAVLELLAVRERLLATAAPGAAAARELASATDRTVTALARDAGDGPGGRWAIVALGGYGSGRMLPASDVDLLVLSDAARSRVKPFAESVFYPLWDAGLALGHQVRTRKQHVAACAADVSTLSASLTARILAGDAGYGDELLGEVARRAHRARRRLLGQFVVRERPGSPFALFPDLKAGAGGRRDLDEMAWTAAVLGAETCRDHAALVPLGLLSLEESERLDAAADTLAAARWSLHLRGGRRPDVLTPEDAEELDTDLTELTAALADVAGGLARVRRRAAGAAEPVPLDTADALLDELSRGETALPALEEAAWAGELDDLAPGLRTLMTLRRPALGHTLTVGAHELAATALVADVAAHDRLAGEALRSLADRRPLLVAALTHDAGKRSPGPGHAVRGEPVARETAARLGVADAADDVAVLVREHLLLAEAAAREDAGDEDAMLRLASRIGKRALVGPLVVLTVADALATSASAWGPWRSAVVGDLASRLDAALAGDVEGAGLARDAERTREAARTLLPAQDAGQTAFLDAAPLRYLASTPPEVVAAHASLAAPLSGVRDLTASRIAVGVGPAEGTWRVTVATTDRPGLFATLAGVLSLAGLSILGAEALSGPDSTVIDVFTVESATLAPVDTATWSGFERLLHAALAGRLDVELRLAERRRHYPVGPRRRPLSVTVGEAGAFTTSVRVEAPDRVGLLHDLAFALAAAGLDIRSATVLTSGGVASDIFRVVDGSGEPPADRGVLADVAARLRAVAIAPTEATSGS